jgi:hypothetical protein
MEKHSSLLDHKYVTMKVNMTHGTVFTTLYLAQYARVGWNGSSGTNTLAYWEHKYVTMKINKGSETVFTTLCFLRSLRMGPIN